jgi:hypothetical protein
MSLLTGHRPGAFEGFQMKDLFDKDRWEKRQRQVQNPRFADEGLPPQMTNWYKGREFSNPTNQAVMDDMVASRIQGGRQSQANAKLFPLRPSPNVQAQRLSASPGARWSGGAALLPERVQTREVVPPAMRTLPQFSSPAQPEGALTAPPTVEALSEYFPPPPNYVQRTLDTGIPGYFGNPNADTQATEEEVEAMNAYRNRMLTDLLAETSEEPEVKAISYYKKKKKRSPKTYRSKSVGYRLRRS